MKFVTVMLLFGLATPLFAQAKPVTAPPPISVQAAPQPPAKPFFSVLDTYDQKTGEPIPVIIANFPKAPHQLLIQDGQGDAVAGCAIANSVLSACTVAPKHTLTEVISVLLQAYQFTGPGASK